MRRLLACLVATAGALTAAPSAHATLVYVKGTNSSVPHVWWARDDGTRPHRIGAGTLPVISPNGRWVAWIDMTHQAVRLRRVKGTFVRTVVRSPDAGTLTFSPDSRWLGLVRGGRLDAYDIAARRRSTLARGTINGFSFSPDSTAIVYGTSGSSTAFDAPSDLYVATLAGGARTRVTRDHRSLYPLWGPAGDIVFDRQTRRAGDAPIYNLYAIHPDGSAFRRITALKIPPLLDGLVPLDFSADGHRLLAEFVGQDTSVGFTVNPATGRTRSLARNVETGFVASALTTDGRTVLGMTGGADPANRHDVVTMPYNGGKSKVLVRRAAYPQWSR
jgi:hypothetical protein